MKRIFIVVTLLIGLVACSSTSDRKAVYQDESEIKKREVKLEVPPDLSEPVHSDRLSVPNISVPGSTYLTFANTDYNDKRSDVLPAIIEEVQIKRDGAIRWLEIRASVDDVWKELIVFFKGVGFDIKFKDKLLGIMQTNWLENRVDIPTNWLTKFIHKLSSSGLLDRYRARLERTDDPAVTRVFITHQGLAEKGSGGDVDDVVSIWWEPRQSDPELEAEMMERYLVFKGVGEVAAKKRVAKVKIEERARIIERDETKVLQVKEGFARTWRRLGIALDRIGLYVEDRNRTNGSYYIRITDDFRQRVKNNEGWFASLFSDKNASLKEYYLFNVIEQGDHTMISINEKSGRQADSGFVEKILADLKSYLN